MSLRLFRAAVCLLALAIAPWAVAELTLVADGQPRAAIVLPPQPTPTETMAAAELREHLQRMSGAVLPDAATPPPGQVAIYIGRAAQQVGVTADALTPEFYRVVTGPGWLAIAGRDDTLAEKVADPMASGTVQPGTLFGVYHLLDNVLGVRWLWPGETGTVVPTRRTVTVPDLDVTDGPQLLQRAMRSARAARTRETLAKTDGVLVADAATAERLAREEQLWLRRQRMGRRTQFAFGHSFTRWWAKYGATHPEYFARLPDRKQPFPSAERAKLCASNPAVIDQIIADWQEAGAKGHLGACPNDSRCYCTCENCRAWDLPVVTTPQNVDESVLTYRYVRFWQALCERAAAVNPEALVCGYAYSNYRQPPEGVKLPGNLILGYVGGRDEAARNEWRQWSEAGAKLFFRPNWFHEGHNTYFMPLHEAAQFLRYAHDHSLLGTDFDSLLGHWSTQGPYYYLVARLQARPELTVEDVIQEYSDGFGAAAPEVRQWLAYWDEHSKAYTALIQDNSEEMRGGARAAIRLMPRVFTEAVLIPAEKLLDTGLAKVPAGSPEAERLRFLQAGMKHLRLTRDTVAANAETGTTRGIEATAFRAVQAARELRNFRKTIQDSCADWPAYCDLKEIELGDFTGLRLVAVLGDRTALAVLPASWRFQFDPQDAGEKEKWFEPAFDVKAAHWAKATVTRWWEQNDVGIAWKKEHGKDYDGVAWYRVRFMPPDLPAGKRLKLLFGAVDEACKVWLNGTPVGEHPYLKPDDWKTPFELDVTDALTKGPNTVVVRVVDTSGAGGIWKLVWLVAE